MAPIALEPETVGLDLSSSTKSLSVPSWKAESRDLPKYQGYDNVHWYVGNAKQAAAFYVTRMGFRRIAYRGLETGSRAVASHVVGNGNVNFIFTSPLHAPSSQKAGLSKEDLKLLEEIHNHLQLHGDAVKDVGFQVDDVEAVYQLAVANGAQVVHEPRTISDDEGVVKTACIRTYGDTSMFEAIEQVFLLTK